MPIGQKLLQLRASVLLLQSTRVHRPATFFPSGSEDIQLLHYINASVARGDGNEGSTGVRHYKKWAAGRGDSLYRALDPLLTRLDVKNQEKLRMARFALFLVGVQGVSASTASGYISTVNAWHRRRTGIGFAADMPLSFSGAFLLGWARSHPPPRGVFHRIGITPQHLAKGMDEVLGVRGSCSPLNQNIRASLACGFAGLLRSCEMCYQDDKPEHFQALPQRIHLSSLPSGSKSILIREAKRNSLKGVAPSVSTPIQFYPGGSLIDAAAELVLLSIADPASTDSPLFRDPSTNKPLKVSFIRKIIKQVAAAAGLDPSFFGAHSLRCKARSSLIKARSSLTFMGSHLP